MTEMKDSGVAWINTIPKKWKLKKIKYALKNRNENNNPIRSKNILSLTAKQGVIPLEEKEGGGNKPKEDYSAYKLAYPNDIVMNSMNVLSGSVGLSKYFGCVSPVYYMLRPIDEKDDVRYYNYIFQTTVFQRSLLGLGNGILMKESDNGKLNTIRMRIPLDKLGNLLIPVPDSSIQRKIADYLDSIIPNIDMLLADIEKQIETLEEYKKSIITEAVTKGLDPDVEMQDSGIEWMGMVPSTWESNKVLNCIDFIGGSQPPLSYFEGEEKEGYVRLIQNRDYKTDDYMTFVPKRMVTKFCEVDDVMIGRYGPPLFVLHRGLKGAYNVAIMKAVPKLLDREFMAFYLQNYTLLQYIESFSKRTAGQAGVNTDILKKYPIYVPPMEEQKEIAIYLEKKCIEIDNVIGKKKEQLETLDQYKKSLVYEYVTGKKEVPDA